MTPAAPTARACALRLLRDFGIISLDPANPAGQKPTIEPGDLDEIAGVMTSTLQEIFDLGPAEMKQRSGGGYLRAPTNVTLTATAGSTTISSMVTFASWMDGCTIRISGEEQDNELLSGTLLARPYIGTGGAGLSAVVYADCLTLDDTIAEILSPVMLSTGARLEMAQSGEQFRSFGIATYGQRYGYSTIEGMGRKSVAAYPLSWFIEGYYDTSLDYVPHRLRVAPMPGAALGLNYVAVLNPPRIVALSIDTGDHTTDPGVKLPIPNGWVESIFLPIARQQLTGCGLFKASESKAEIARSYQAAVKRLQGARAGGGGMWAKYL